MAVYELLGTKVAFSDAEERYLDLFYRERKTAYEARDRYLAWYKQAGSIEYVLDNLMSFEGRTLGEVVLQPLFQELAQYEIYDIGWDVYIQKCAQFPNMQQAGQKLQSQYNEIERKRQAEAAYRENRKESRSRWSGGGFGLSGALKGAAEAAALNAVSGLGHSAVNAVGNAGSSVVSSSAKASLYRSEATRNQLENALYQDVHLLFTRHIDLLNRCKNNWIVNSFSVSRSNSLLENAKKLPDKRNTLLIDAFRLCPWSGDLLRYLFTYAETDQDLIVSLAKRFGVDVSVQIEQLLANLYTDSAHVSEAEAQKARAKILQTMEKYSVTSSATLNTLENDCLARICNGYETASEADCQAMIASIEEYEAQDNLKRVFLKKLQVRIQSIWSTEDGETFSNLYKQVDLTDAEARNKAAAMIQSQARTDVAKKYIKALQKCTPKKIKRARIYKYGKRPKIYTILIILSIVLSFAGAASLCVPTAIFFLYLMIRLKSAWKLLTLDGTVIPPLLDDGSTPQPKPAIPAAVPDAPTESQETP